MRVSHRSSRPIPVRQRAGLATRAALAALCLGVAACHDSPVESGSRSQLRRLSLESSSGACAHPPSGLLAWWRAEGNTEDFVGGRNGSFVGLAAYDAGMVGQAFHFTGTTGNGGNFVSVPDDPIWTLGTNAFTIELWQRVDLFQEYNLPIGHDEGPGNINKWLFYTSNRDGFGFLTSATEDGVVHYVFTTIGGFNLGQWNHLAITRDAAGNYVLYRDGQAVFTAFDPSPIADPAAPLTIGGAEAIRFNGLVDEVSIYARALTQSEVAAIAAAGAAGKCTEESVPPDSDGDGFPDDNDNCPAVANPDQADNDGDGIGDACDTDIDGDGVLNTADNCPAVSNADQRDADGDRIGDLCDPTPFPPDADGDGIFDSGDNCRTTPNPDQADSDHDGIGNACEADSDGDRIIDDVDNCPGFPNPEQGDIDNDGLGDFCDYDTDGDGLPNSQDLEPWGTPWASRFQGFFQPVDNGNVFNTVKAGSGIPIKFSLGGDIGLNILPFPPQVEKIACNPTAPADAIEQTVTAGTSSLTYDATSGHYIYAWKTDKSWAGTCRRFVLVLRDGTKKTALFQFSK